MKPKEDNEMRHSLSMACLLLALVVGLGLTIGASLSQSPRHLADAFYHYLLEYQVNEDEQP